jgi:hypothetical protein
MFDASGSSSGSPQPVYYKRKKSFLHELFD